MAKAKPINPAAAEALAQANAAAAANAPIQTGHAPVDTANAVKNPPVKSDKELKAEQKAAFDKMKAEAKAQADKEKADKKAQADKEKAERKEQRAAAAAERKAKLAEIGGSMAALGEAVKSGKYVKGVTGQLHSGDALAQALDGIAPVDVVGLAISLLKLPENPYANLNIGQQSMNLRNKLRGVLKKDIIKLSDISDYIARNKIVQVTAEQIAAAREAAAKAKAEKKEAEAKKKAGAAKVEQIHDPAA